MKVSIKNRRRMDGIMAVIPFHRLGTAFLNVPSDEHKLIKDEKLRNSYARSLLCKIGSLAKLSPGAS